MPHSQDKYSRFAPVECDMEFDWFAKDRPEPPPPKPKRLTQWDFIMSGENDTNFDRKQRMIFQMSDLCRTCTMCELGRRQAEKNGTCRDPHVLSNLKPSRFVVVGQNPGWDELAAGCPFVGAAGKNFDREIEKNGLTRDELYITNVVKCWTKNNAKPDVKHVHKCKPFLQMEFNLLNPLLVVTLGAVPFGLLCPDAVYGDCLQKITKSEQYGVNVFAIYHPSPLNLTQEVRRTMFGEQVRVLGQLVKKLKKRHKI